MNSKQRRQYRRKAKRLFPIGCKVRIRPWHNSATYSVAGYHPVYPERVWVESCFHRLFYVTWTNLRLVDDKKGEQK